MLSRITFIISVDRATNTLYFSYTTNKYDDTFKTAKININTKEFSDINGVPNGFAQSVDPKTSDVYVGGSEGIYKYNRNTNKAEFFIANEVDIWLLYYKDALYFSEYPSQFLFTVVDGNVTRYKDLEDTKVDNFVIDDDDNIFFTNYSGLYSQKKGTKDAVYYEDSTDVSIRGLTTDGKGNVYACVQSGIYAVNKEKHVLEKIYTIDDAFGVAFDDSDNLIYADAKSLVRLKKSNDQDCDKTDHGDHTK